MIRGNLLHEKQHVWLVLFLCLVGRQSVQAFSTGAGACPADTPAVSGPHLSNQAGVTQKPFDDAYTFLINDSAVTATTTLVRGESYTLAVKAKANPFRGALIRLDLATGLLAPGTTSMLATNCGPSALGLTHSAATEKTQLDGTYTVPAAGTESQVNFDVTVVESNNANAGSVYSYKKFTVPVRNPAVPTVPPAPPAPLPVNAPVASPVVIPTMASPMAAPPIAVVPRTGSPIPPAPVAAPVTAPVATPVAAPVTAPVATPVAAPVTLPTATVITPMAAPIPMPPPPFGNLTNPTNAPVTIAAPTVTATTIPPFPTIPIAWRPTTKAPAVPTARAPFPTVPLPWLPTTATPIRMPSMADIPTIPLPFLPTTPLMNGTMVQGNGTAVVMVNGTDVQGNLTNMNGTNVGNVTGGFSMNQSNVEAVESSSLAMGSISYLLMLLGSFTTLVAILL